MIATLLSAVACSLPACPRGPSVLATGRPPCSFSAWVALQPCASLLKPPQTAHATVNQHALHRPRGGTDGARRARQVPTGALPFRTPCPRSSTATTLQRAWGWAGRPPPLQRRAPTRLAARTLDCEGEQAVRESARAEVTQGCAGAASSRAPRVRRCSTRCVHGASATRLTRRTRTPTFRCHAPSSTRRPITRRCARPRPTSSVSLCLLACPSTPHSQPLHPSSVLRDAGRRRAARQVHQHACAAGQGEAQGVLGAGGAGERHRRARGTGAPRERGAPAERVWRHETDGGRAGAPAGDAGPASAAR